MESLVGVLSIGVIGMLVCELFILVWFLKRMVDLNQGNTYFKVSRKIPIVYVVFSLLVAVMIMSSDQSPISGLLSPLSTRENQALSFFLLANLTTPLFPLGSDEASRNRRNRSDNPGR
jgi:C4-dicarboxylate transporter